MKNELSLTNWNVIKEQAIVLVKSGFLPPSVKTPEQAIAIALKGQELGLPIMASYALIDIIQGRPTLKPEGMLALILKNCPSAIINFVKIEDNCCVIEATRPGHKLHVFKFDESDAKSAGLLNKSNWKQFPRAMFRSRCVAEMSRSLFPDIIMGCSYTKEELMPDASITADDDIPLPTHQPLMIEEQAYIPPRVEVKSAFNRNNVKHMDKLKAILLDKGIAEVLWDKIAARMQGKPSSDVDLVIKEFENEIFVEDLKSKQKTDFTDIPFSYKTEVQENETSVQEGANV